VNSKFERDTSVKEMSPGVFEGNVNRDWWIIFGPNGGFIAAMIVRAMAATVADPERQARSLTIHYAAPPEAGPVQIATTVERAGRSLSTLSARMEQNGRLIAIAIGAFSKPRRAAIEFDDTHPPQLPSPEDVPVTETPPSVPPFAHQWETRYAIGLPPFSGAQESTLTGGWIRPLDPSPIDAPLVAQITDAWLPAVFVRLSAPDAVPTIDLTIHFRAELPLPADHLLVTFETRLSAEGFVEEDGWIWSRDGRLIAHSRQLALLQARSQD
jgi:acyl-CoA thioesterase